MAIKNTISLATLNVNGTNNKDKRNRVIQWVKTQKVSITFLQESHFDGNVELEIRNKTNFEISRYRMEGLY